MSKFSLEYCCENIPFLLLVKNGNKSCEAHLVAVITKSLSPVLVAKLIKTAAAYVLANENAKYLAPTSSNRGFSEITFAVSFKPATMASAEDFKSPLVDKASLSFPFITLLKQTRASPFDFDNTLNTSSDKTFEVPSQMLNTCASRSVLGKLVSIIF